MSPSAKGRARRSCWRRSKNCSLSVLKRRSHEGAHLRVRCHEFLVSCHADAKNYGLEGAYLQVRHYKSLVLDIPTRPSGRGGICFCLFQRPVQPGRKRANHDVAFRDFVAAASPLRGCFCAGIDGLTAPQILICGCDTVSRARVLSSGDFCIFMSGSRPTVPPRAIRKIREYLPR